MAGPTWGFHPHIEGDMNYSEAMTRFDEASRDSDAVADTAHAYIALNGALGTTLAVSAAIALGFLVGWVWGLLGGGALVALQFGVQWMILRWHKRRQDAILDALERALGRKAHSSREG